MPLAFDAWLRDRRESDNVCFVFIYIYQPSVVVFFLSLPDSLYLTSMNLRVCKMSACFNRSKEKPNAFSIEI